VAIDSPSSDDVVGLSDTASVVELVPADSWPSSPLHARRDDATKTAVPAATSLAEDIRRTVPYLPLPAACGEPQVVTPDLLDRMTNRKKIFLSGR